MIDPLQFLGTVGGILGAVLVSFKRPWAGHCVWLFANGCWVAHGFIYDNWYLVTLFGVYEVVALVGFFNYRPDRTEKKIDERLGID